MATLTTQAFSQFIYDFSGGSQVFDTPFALGVLSPSHVTAFVTGEVDGLGDQIYRPILYDADTGTTTVLDSLGTGPLELVIQRTVPKDALYVSFASGADVTRTNIDTTVRYTLMALHETLDGRWSSAAFDALIIAVGQAVSAKDAAEVAAGLAEAARDASESFAIDTDIATASASASAAAAAATLANAALKSADLSDMASKPTALTNLRGYTTTATAAGTTTLTVASTLGLRFTGSTTQTIVLPVASTLALGWEYTIENASTGVLTVNSSGGNLVATIPAGVTARIKCVLASGTTAASWSLAFSGFQTAYVRTFVTPRDFDPSAGTGGDDTTAVAAAMASDLPMYIDRTYIISAAVTHSTGAAKRVYGNGPSTSRITMTNATQDGLVKTGGGSLTVESISVTTSINKTAGAAVKTSGTYKDIIRDCHIFGPSTSLKLFVGININGLIPCVENNYILTCTNIGLTIDNTTSGEGSEGIVSGNTFNTAQPSNTAIAINWTSGLRTLRVFANTFQNYAYGMNVAPATGHTPMSLDFFGNVLELNSVGGLVCTLPGGSTTVMDAVMINGNQFNESTGKAIILTGATNFIRIVNITGNVFDMGSTGQLSLWNGGNVNICSNTFVSANSAHVPIQLAAALPVATFMGSNNSLALTTLYAKNGNTGAYKAAAIVAA